MQSHRDQPLNSEQNSKSTRTNTKNKKVLIYARVSTSDQNPQIQISELRRYCEARQWDVTEEIIDLGFTGANDKRPGLQKLLSMAKSRQIDVVVVVKLDRLFRSLKHLVSTMQELTELGVEFISVKDQIDMTTASGRLMVHMLGAFSEFEKSLIVERTIAGITHARNQGKRLGRPPVADSKKIRELRTAGFSYRKIMNQLGVSMGVVCRAIEHAPKSPTNLEVTEDAKTKG